MKIDGLYRYPLKSARGIALTAAEVESGGILGDRRSMIVDPDGHFITQRELPLLARIQAQDEDGHLVLEMGGHRLNVAHPPTERRKDVAIWKSVLSAALADEESNAVLSAWLGRPVQLVFFDAMSQRHASAEWAGPDTPVAFADGYQILLTSTGSLSALNADLAAHGEGAVGMDRFRPNIVVDGPAWWEDEIAAIEIGGLRFDLVKPCTRCIITTQDQMTGARDVASPMPALGRLRMSADRRVPGVLFGWNLVPRGSGRIALGDEVRILEHRGEAWPLKRRGPAAAEP